MSHKEQAALDSRTKEITIGQALKMHEYIQSDRKIVEKLSCHNQKEVRHDNEARQLPKNNQDVCLNKNFLRNRYHDTDVESTRAPRATNQMPKYQPFNIQSTTECDRASLPRNHSCGTWKESEILDRPTKQRPICEPLKLENRRHVWDCTKKTCGKQKCNTHKDCLSLVRGAVPCSHTESTPNGLEKEVSSNKLVGNGSHVRPILPELLLSCHDINSQERPPSSNTPQSYFPAANGRPLETIEFGSLGPFALPLSSLKSNGANNTQTTSKVFTDVSPIVLQRSRATATENR